MRISAVPAGPAILAGPAVPAGPAGIRLYFFLQLVSTNRSNFGLVASGYMLGYLSSATIKNAKFLHMISGAGWLVRKYVHCTA